MAINNIPAIQIILHSTSGHSEFPDNATINQKRASAVVQACSHFYEQTTDRRQKREENLRLMVGGWRVYI